MRHILFFLIFFTFSLHANAFKDPEPVSLVNMTAMPSSMVNGCVSVISGDLFESEKDYTLSGPDPYTLGHTYSSSGLEEGTLGAGWNFYHHHYLQVYQPEGINFAEARSKRNAGGYKVHGRPPNEYKNPYTYLSIIEPSGGTLLFKGNGWGRHFHLMQKGTGFTNVFGGEIGGQTNIRNIRINWYAATDHWHVTFGDGTRRVYGRMKKPRHKRVRYKEFYYDYHLIREVKPSGNSLLFSYNHNDELTQIVTCSHDHSQKHSWIRFHQKSDSAFEKNPSLHIETSDHQKCTFRYKKLKNHTYSVSHIERPGMSGVHFSYCGPSSHHHRRVNKRSIDSGHFLETYYYSKEDGSFLRNRVKSQVAPIGPNGKKVVTHRFAYHKQKKGEKTSYATVTDAYGTITRYHWNESKRLVWIIKYSPSWKRLMSEQFVWGTNTFAGHLKARTLFDENNTPLLTRKFNYDSRGNVIKESVYGQFTENAGRIILSTFGYPKPSSCDRVDIERTFSKDGYNLKLSEKDPDGNYTYYRYKKGSNLLIAKFTCDKKAIKKREFFAYDKSALLISHIVDDGVSFKREDLKGITERHITRIKARQQMPHFGEPEVVEECYLDLETKKVCLLKRTVNSYSAKGFLTEQKIYDALGKLQSSTMYGHDSVGRVVYTKDAFGGEQHLEYDKFGRLIKQQGPHMAIYYSYDLCNRLVSQTEVQKNGLSLTTSYEYDLLGRKTLIRDPQGHHTKFSYDRLDRITKIVLPTIYDCDNKAIAATKIFEYSKLGTEVIQTDESGYRTKTTFNATGKIVSRELPDKTVTKNLYDLRGNCIKEVVSNGVEQHIKYDAFNRPISCTMKKGDKLFSRKIRRYTAFHLVSETNSTGETVECAYDYAGRKKAITLKGKSGDTHRTTSFQYDSMGRVKQERCGDIIKEFTYDVFDRVISESVKNTSYTIYGYDLDGNCVEVIRSIMGEPAVTTTVYDAYRRISSQTNAQGHTWSYFYDDLAANTKKTSVDPAGITEEELFDSHGNLSCAARFDPFGMCIAKKKLFYDASGNCVRIQESCFVQGKEEKTVSTLLAYGPNNRLECITEAYNSEEEKTTKYVYNNFGRKIKTIHADGSTVDILYDVKGRVKRVFGKEVDYEYSYDASDRITDVFNAITNKNTSRSYDEIGNLISETLESGLVMEYTYDEHGRVIELTLPDSSKVTYSYSSALLQSVKRLDSTNEELWTHRILERDLSGNILSAELPLTAGKMSFGYDRLNRRTTINHPAFEEKLLQFDPSGNLLELSFKDSVGTSHNSYCYDDLYQLTEETGHVAHIYAYDSLRNRILHDERTYRTNSLHSVLHDGKKTFCYDERGNRSKMGDIHYSYDALDRLIAVTTPTQKTTYSYDAFDRRIEKKQLALEQSEWKEINGEHYLYVMQNEIGCIDSFGMVAQLRILGEGLGAEIGAAVAIELDGLLHIPIHDHRGNVTALLDGAGAVVESYRYDAYGNEEVFSTVESGNPWRFASKRVDPETGLVYFGRRYYDPSIGKWLTHDPLGLKAGPNLYAYVLNNPMTHLDLYGLIEETTEGRSIGGRIVDAVCDGLRRVRDVLCKAVEQVVHHIPHLGRLNDHLQDGIRWMRGSKPKNRPSSGCYPISSGTRTETGCEEIIYVNGILCSLKGVKKNVEALTEKMTGAIPTVTAFYSETRGLMMDLLRATANFFGIETSNIQPLREAAQGVTSRLMARNDSSYAMVTVHSNGGVTFDLATRGFFPDQRSRMAVEGVASTRLFNDSDGFIRPRNATGKLDLTSFIADPIRFCREIIAPTGSFELVGSWFSLPFANHAYRSKEYAPVLQGIAARHSRGF